MWRDQRQPYIPRVCVRRQPSVVSTPKESQLKVSFGILATRENGCAFLLWLLLADA